MGCLGKWRLIVIMLQVLQIFREVETAKEGKLGLCREIRTQVINTVL